MLGSHGQSNTGEITAIIPRQQAVPDPYQARPPAAIAVAAMNPRG